MKFEIKFKIWYFNNCSYHNIYFDTKHLSLRFHSYMTFHRNLLICVGKDYKKTRGKQEKNTFVRYVYFLLVIISFSGYLCYWSRSEDSVSCIVSVSIRAQNSTIVKFDTGYSFCGLRSHICMHSCIFSRAVI